jgi:hypothetical protein
MTSQCKRRRRQQQFTKYGHFSLAKPFFKFSTFQVPIVSFHKKKHYNNKRDTPSATLGGRIEAHHLKFCWNVAATI